MARNQVRRLMDTLRVADPESHLPMSDLVFIGFFGVKTYSIKKHSVLSRGALNSIYLSGFQQVLVVWNQLRGISHSNITSLKGCTGSAYIF